MVYSYNDILHLSLQSQGIMWITGNGNMYNWVVCCYRNRLDIYYYRRMKLSPKYIVTNSTLNLNHRSPTMPLGRVGYADGWSGYKGQFKFNELLTMVLWQDNTLAIGHLLVMHFLSFKQDNETRAKSLQKNNSLTALLWTQKLKLMNKLVRKYRTIQNLRIGHNAAMTKQMISCRRCLLYDMTKQ